MEFVTNEAEVDRSSAKIAAVAVVGLLLALATSFFLKQFLGGGGLNASLLALASVIAYLVVFVLQPVLIKSASKLYFIVFFEAVALASAFYDLPPAYLLACTIVPFIILALGSSHEIQEVQERVKIRISKITHRGLRNGMSALSVLIVLAYIGGIKTNGAVLPKSAFAQILAPASPLIQLIYPGISLSDSFEKSAQILIEQQLAGSPEAKLLSASQRQAFVNQGTEALRGQFSEFLGVKFATQETITDILYKWVNANFGALSASAQSFVWIAAGVLGYASVRGLGLILIWPIEFLAFLLFEILLLTKFAFRFSEAKSREVVILK